MLNTRVVSSEGEMFLPRRLGREMINDLLTSVLPVWPGLMGSHRF